MGAASEPLVSGGQFEKRDTNEVISKQVLFERISKRLVDVSNENRSTQRSESLLSSPACLPHNQDQVARFRCNNTHCNLKFASILELEHHVKKCKSNSEEEQGAPVMLEIRLENQSDQEMQDEALSIENDAEQN